MKPPTGMPLTPCALLAIAQTLVGFEDDTSGRGPLVRMMLSAARLPANAPWSAAFVAHVGVCSHTTTDPKASSWPLPRRGNGDHLAAFGHECGIAHTHPEWADVALLWSAEKRRYSQVGIVVDFVLRAPSAVNVARGMGLGELRLTTIEGNVTRSGAPNGNGVHRVTRTVNDAERPLFLRWVDLDARGAVSNPTRRRRAVAQERNDVITRVAS